MRAGETGFLRAGGHRPYTVHRVGCGEAQGLAAAQGGGGQTPFPGSAAVVGNAEGAALVIVQSTSCRGQHGSKNQRERWAEGGRGRQRGAYSVSAGIHFSEKFVD